MSANNLSKLLVAAEPTGYYWFGLADYLKDEEIAYRYGWISKEGLM